MKKKKQSYKSSETYRHISWTDCNEMFEGHHRINIDELKLVIAM